jgi:hypothetical protein
MKNGMPAAMNPSKCNKRRQANFADARSPFLNAKPYE